MRWILSRCLRVGFGLGLAVVVAFWPGAAIFAQGGLGAFAGAGFGFAGKNQPAAVEKPVEKSIDEKIQSGRELFLHRWKKADVASPTGDGLGPVYNARSCAECHSQTQPGGAGTNDHNVDLLTVTPPNIRAAERAKFATRMTAIDPVLTAGFTSVRPSVTLHKFGTDPDYDQWRKNVVKLVGGKERDADAGKRPAAKTVNQLLAANARITAADKSASIGKSDLLHVGIAQRSTPALFGAGLIDSISDNALREEAKDQADRHDWIKGQLAAAVGGVGKFGWRGQTATLKEFVMGACANELGLEVPGHSQGVDPLDPIVQSPGMDLTQQQCDDLTDFVASLPRPEQRRPMNDAERTTWDAGEQVFDSIGCVTCHARKVGQVDGLYSDLLLHDLGPKLSDPAGASPSSGGASPAYYGGPTDVFVAVPPITRRQWRTAPLWGVADSAPYLHDGRAATLQEAIEAHAGEALPAAKLYAALPAAERAKLLAFLGSLAAPSPQALVAQK